jgi:hypothetical protein
MVCDDPVPDMKFYAAADQSCPLRRFEQAARIPFRVTLAENRVAGDQQLGSRFDDAGDRIVSDAAVHFNPITEAQFLAKFFQAANLAEGVRDELLAAEAGIDAHDEDMVHHAEDGDEQVDGCGGLMTTAGCMPCWAMCSRVRCRWRQAS